MVEAKPCGKVNVLAMPDDPKRGTGRTTALMLHAIAHALESPDQWVAYRDHYAHPISMNQTYIRCILGMAERLGLTIEVDEQDGHIMLRSPINSHAAKDGSERIPMVENEPLSQVNDQLAATSVRIAMVPIGQCDLLEKNAGFMRAEQYQRLVSNVKRDGCLTSVPFAVKNGERFLILSGNHRVQAAKDAKLPKSLVLTVPASFPRPAAGNPAVRTMRLPGRTILAILASCTTRLTTWRSRSIPAWTTWCSAG